jgi:transcriptional regulator with XRE-family HTH domain
VENIKPLAIKCGMPKNATQPVTEHITVRLRKLRERAGLSMQQVAEALGYSHASGYQRYEDADMYTKKYISVEMAEKLVPILVGLGNPPIKPEEVMALAGLPIPTPESLERLLTGYSPRKRAIALSGIAAFLRHLEDTWNESED